MTASSRAKQGALAAAVAGGLMVAAPVFAPAFAQDTESGPVPLFPSDPVAPDATGEAQDGPKLRLPEKRVIETDSGTITVERLEAVDPNTTGLLSAEGSLGIDMWQGTGRGRIHTLLKNLPSEIPSPALRNLAYRLLTSSAELPAPSGQGDANRNTLLSLRIIRLAQLGFPQDALALYESADLSRNSNQDLTRTVVEASLLSGEVAKACGIVRDQQSGLQTPYWQKHLILCELSDGNMDAARFGATLLEDKGEDDRLFFALVSKIADGLNLSLPETDSLTPLHMGLMWLAEEPLPAGAVDGAGPAMLRAIASNPHTSLDTRLKAAEKAAQLGALDADMLAELYKTVPFDAAELQRPISIATETYDTHGRALLFQAASIETAPETKALIIGTSLKLARQNGFYAAAVALHKPQVQQMPVRGDLSQFAGEATRLLFAAGRPKPAEAWLEHLRIQAARNPEAQLQYQRLWALARLASDDYNAARDEADRTGWVEALSLESQDESGRTLARKAYLAYRLLDVAGQEPASDKAWAELAVNAPAQRATKPNPAATTLMVRAAQKGARAEAVAWMLIALGDQDSRLTDPDVLVDAIYTLRSLGLAGDAQQFAIETALVNDL